MKVLIVMSVIDVLALSLFSELEIYCCFFFNHEFMLLFPIKI